MGKNKKKTSKTTSTSTLNSAESITPSGENNNEINPTKKCYNYTEIKVNPDFRPKSQRLGCSTDPNSRGRFYPIVSVCTPTFNRRPFIPTMFSCFKNQIYPKNSIEWIIVDDGTDPIDDIISSSGIENIKYYRLNEKMPLGEKRNFMHTKVSGSIIVYMDDDDYYPPERIFHAVERLQENKDALCAGSSEIYIYYNHIQTMIKFGPYGPNHATAGTFAFRVELLKQTQYEDNASLAEERAFLKDYTIPFVQLDPMKTILVFSHGHNTFDKKNLLENIGTPVCNKTDKTVTDFIRHPNEAPIMKFFTEKMENILASYSFGEPKNKPDVLMDIERINKKRKAMMENQPMMTGNAPPKPNSIHLMADGKILFVRNPQEPPAELSPTNIIEILHQQEQKIQFLSQQIQEKETIIQKLSGLLQQTNSASDAISTTAAEKT